LTLRELLCHPFFSSADGSEAAVAALQADFDTHFSAEVTTFVPERAASPAC
jgi:hypothetical protein